MKGNRKNGIQAIPYLPPHPLTHPQGRETRSPSHCQNIPAHGGSPKNLSASPRLAPVFCSLTLTGFITDEAQSRLQPKQHNTSHRTQSTEHGTDDHLHRTRTTAQMIIFTGCRMRGYNMVQSFEEINIIPFCLSRFLE